MGTSIRSRESSAFSPERRTSTGGRNGSRYPSERGAPGGQYRIDHARRRGRVKGGGSGVRVLLSNLDLTAESDPEEVLRKQRTLAVKTTSDSASSRCLDGLPVEEGGSYWCAPSYLGAVSVLLRSAPEGPIDLRAYHFGGRTWLFSLLAAGNTVDGVRRLLEGEAPGEISVWSNFASAALIGSPRSSRTSGTTASSPRSRSSYSPHSWPRPRRRTLQAPLGGRRPTYTQRGGVCARIRSVLPPSSTAVDPPLSTTSRPAASSSVVVTSITWLGNPS